MKEQADNAKERQRNYSRRHEEKRREAGDVRHVVWLSPEAEAALQKLMVVGSPRKREEVINQAIINAAKNK